METYSDPIEDGEIEEEGNNEMTHTIKYELSCLELDVEKKLASCQLTMPKPLRHPYYPRNWSCEKVTLDIKDFNPNNVYSLTIMRELSHPNILKSRTVMESKCSLLNWAETYSGTLSSFLESSEFGPVSEDTCVLPTLLLQGIVSQLVDGVEHLRLSGYYHGNLTLDSTYYYEDPKTSGIVVKLANFKKKEKGKSLEEALADDWVSISRALGQIVQMAERLNNYRKDGGLPQVDCCQIQGLRTFLSKISPSTFRKGVGIGPLVKRQPFFWDEQARKKFYICRVPLALDNKGFASKISKFDFIEVPWNKPCLNELMRAMNDYRISKNMPIYDVMSRKDFVLMVSGSYSHEGEIEAIESVDRFFMEKHPRLAFDLFSEMPLLDDDKL